uniref:Tropomyosin-2 n=1 Tax=Angiostrongylus cantonensis TaxID=6313 RepID=A0A0K0DBY6_ANGCA
MDAIKKKMQAMKIEKDNALDRADAAEEKVRQITEKLERVEEELRDTQKKMMQTENDLDKAQLITGSTVISILKKFTRTSIFETTENFTEAEGLNSLIFKEDLATATSQLEEKEKKVQEYEIRRGNQCWYEFFIVSCEIEPYEFFIVSCEIEPKECKCCGLQKRVCNLSAPREEGYRLALGESQTSHACILFNH